MEDKKILIADNANKHNANSVDNNYPFSDVKYICQSTTLITESIQKGFDIAQLPNGDITVTEVKIVNVHYSWDPIKQKFTRTSQS